MSQEELLRVEQHKRLARDWCWHNNRRDLAKVPWYRLAKAVRKSLRWSELPEAMQVAHDAAMHQAREAIKNEGVLFPEGWVPDAP